MLLNADSITDFELGAPGVVGGSLNDLIDVEGQLTLDGTLNLDPVATGYYRLFNYGTTLIDNGASVVSTLGTGTLQLATNQVNVFVNNAGQIMQFWDGPETTADGDASGGAGTWNAASTNWTAPPDFNFSDAWQSQVGVFDSPGGIVNVVGEQSFQGLQFSGDGYQLTGGELTLLGDAPGGTPTQSFVNVDAGISASISSVIGGDAPDIGLRKIGTGTLTLSGANTYTGGTTFGAGVVSVAADNNLGGAAGGLTFNGGTLRVTGPSFNDTARSIALEAGGGTFDIVEGSNVFVASQAITGVGSLTKQGIGTLVLANDNSYSGTTNIDGGTLQVGNGGTAGSLGTGDTTNNGQLDFNRSDAGTYAGVISGAGDVGQIGSGQTTLSGQNTYTGATAVTAGTLQVNGSIAASSGLTIGADGTVSGIGTLPTTQIFGTVSPGNSIGTLTAAGDVTFNPGSVFIVETEAPDQADLLSVTGTATIGGGEVQVTNLSAETSYQGGQRYRIIEAGTVVNDAGFTVANQFLFLASDLEYGANYVDIVLAAGVPGQGYTSVADTFNQFQSVANTFNQVQAATGLNNLEQSGDALAVYNELLFMTDANEARRAFDLSSGEIHASGQHVIDQTFGLFARTLRQQASAGVDGGTNDGDTRVHQAWLAPLGGARNHRRGRECRCARPVVSGSCRRL